MIRARGDDDISPDNQMKVPDDFIPFITLISAQG